MIRRTLCWSAAGLCCLLLGCNTPSTVGKYAAESARVLRTSSQIFADEPGTCVRRVSNQSPFQPAWDAESRKAENDPACSALKARSDEQTHAAEVLEKYFEAVQQIAEFGVPAKGPDSASTAVNITKPTQLEAGLEKTRDLSSLLTHILIDGYQRGKLRKYAEEADPDIAAVTQALEGSVRNGYLPLLKDEEDNVEDRYFRFGRTDAKDNQALLYLLNLGYLSEKTEIDHRRQAAMAYMAALAKIREGHHQLLQKNGMHTKDLEAAGAAYADQIEALADDLNLKL